MIHTLKFSELQEKQPAHYQVNGLDLVIINFSVYGLNGHTIDYSTVKSLSSVKCITGENWNGAALPLNEVRIDAIQAFLNETIA